MRYPNIERLLGLHQELSIIYVVDGYEATLRNEEGYPGMEITGHGSIIEDVLEDLNNQCQ